MKPLRHISIGTAVCVCLLSVAALAADWPHWRGPNASGVAADATLPVRWSATENIAWKASIAGAGVSTPIVSGDRVYVTSQIGTGIRREGNHPRLVQGADAAAQGAKIYWDNTARKLTTTAASNALVGCLASAKAGTETTAHALLDGVIR